MDWWVVAVIVGGAVVLAAVAVGVRLSRGTAMLAGMAADWERDRAAIAAVLREDLESVRARVYASGDAAAAADLRVAEQAADRFAANENWADNLRAATLALGRANRAVLGGDQPPCVFSPVHGPAAAEVEWAPGGGARRRVPVCADDAARLRDGGQPLVRMVTTEDGTVPYFGAHGRYVDWLLGWYDGFDPYLTARLLAGTPIGSHLPGRIRAIHGTASDPLGEFGRVHD
ncbi:hypothetical protein Vau01_076780 [Virgisporangium aurantiacum]|uniref:Uncharacterized protein n=1 Tax=Virgisporangium aurantiacum TaxID=175570 RepID=A0A8J4E5R9_9ACTN|nr:hypothetical protein Vau01_076780 [Virgisporangium aurantiacum]